MTYFCKDTGYNTICVVGIGHFIGLSLPIPHSIKKRKCEIEKKFLASVESSSEKKGDQCEPKTIF
jgi:hypothetical protein